MGRRIKSKQLSQAEIEHFLAAAEGLHKAIVGPLISPTCDHYRSLQVLHAALLKTVREVIGRDPPFIQPNGTGPVQPPTA